METVYGLIEGAFGAILMVGFGLISVFSFPICLLVAMFSAVGEKTRPLKFYLILVAVPLVSLVLAVGTFILRAMTATFFHQPPLQ
jgi:hypothetical protein